MVIVAVSHANCSPPINPISHTLLCRIGASESRRLCDKCPLYWLSTQLRRPGRRCR